MRKILLPALLLIVGLFVFAACGGNDDNNNNANNQEQDSRIVGMWSFEFMGMVLPNAYDFRADGTGTRWPGEEYEDRFNWHTNGNNLYVTMTSGAAFDNPLFLNNENWTFTISGDTLTLTSRQEDMVEVLIRQ